VFHKKSQHWKLLIGLLLGGALMAAVACGAEEAAAPTTAPAAPAAPAATAKPAAPAQPAAPAAPAATAKPGAPAAVAPTAKPAAPAQPAATVAAPKAPSGEVIVATLTMQSNPQRPSKDIGGVGHFGLAFSIYDALIRAPYTAPPNNIPLTGYEPWIAESWTVAADLSSITFKIRKGIQFHKGWGELTAEDVAWTFNDAFLPESVNNGAEELSPELRAGFDVLDPYTVRMNIGEGGYIDTWQFWFVNIGFDTIGIVSKKAYDELGDEGYARETIGTGVYQNTSWRADDEIVSTAITDHFSGIVPDVKTFRAVMMPEVATREAALRTNEIDMGELPIKQLDSVVKAIGGYAQEVGVPRPRGFQFAGNYWGHECTACAPGEVVFPRPGYAEAIEKGYPWVGELGNDESMENARLVRTALNMAIDREKINATVLRGFGRPIYAWMNILPSDPRHKAEWVYPFDVAKAKEYLTQAGYPNGFDMEVWVAGTFPDDQKESGIAAAEMWREFLNIDVTIDQTAYATRRPTTVDKTLNVPFLHGINWMPGQTAAQYICPQSGHIVGLELEDEVCAIGVSNQTELDFEKRKANNEAVQDYVSHWALSAMIVQFGQYYAVGPRIAEWSPYNVTQVEVNSPETIVLK